jgi:hypothetical protein
MCVGCVLCVCACGIVFEFDRSQCVWRLCMCYSRPCHIDFRFCMSGRAVNDNVFVVMLCCRDVKLLWRCVVFGACVVYNAFDDH